MSNHEELLEKSAIQQLIFPYVMNEMFKALSVTV